MELSSLASSAIDTFALKQEENHIADLQGRLDRVASYATYKGNRKPIGSTLPFKNRIKNEAIKAVHGSECQFKGNIMTDGRHEYYLDDGELIHRTSSI